MKLLLRPGLFRSTRWCLLVLVSASSQLVPSGAGLFEVEDHASERVVRRVVRDAGSRRSQTRLEAWRRMAGMGQELAGWHAEIEEDARRAAQSAFSAIQDGTTMDELVDLASRRAELDRLRAHALELIRDEERYFYPSRTPDVTVERARLFPPVRREVEQRVDAVRVFWEGDEGVDVPASVRVAIGELISIEPIAEKLGFELAWPQELPRWILGVARASGRIGLGNFAWTTEQLRQLRYDRAVMEYNECRWPAPEASTLAWETAGDSDALQPIECDQVRLTNSYRRMLGECALAWSDALQRAARGHSQYMLRTSVLTHTARLDGHETPTARMRSEGYHFGQAENIYFGPGGALAAHLRWVGSSAHHRALLDPRMRGMASAEVGGYWTQNLGSSTSFTGTPEFENALWHD